MLPAKSFYMIRHGETTANVAKVIAGGRNDSPLTDRGRAQAANMASLIHSLPVKPTKILHSPMQRAKHTAQAINKALNLVMHEIDDLREHIFGEWEGKKWEEIEALVINDIRPKGGESSQDFMNRFRDVMNNIIPEHEGPIMIVAHGGLFHAFAKLYGHNIEGVDNCQLHFFEPNDNYIGIPWKISHFIADNGKLVKTSAPFCGSNIAA
jgi:probable phosphoglycerate mutase